MKGKWNNVIWEIILLLFLLELEERKCRQKHTRIYKSLEMCIQYKHAVYSLMYRTYQDISGKVLHILINNIMGKWLNNQVKSVKTKCQTWTDMSTIGVQKGPGSIFHALNACKL